MSILKVNTIQDKGGNTLLSSDGAGAISSGGLITNTPAFLAYRSASNQSIADGAFAKIQFQTVEYDTHSGYDNTTNYRYTIPSGQGGKYFIYTQALLDSGASTNMNYCHLVFYKNGSAVWVNHANWTANDIRSVSPLMSIAIDLNAGDYIEVFVIVNNNSGTPSVRYLEAGGSPTFFGAYKLIGA